MLLRTLPIAAALGLATATAAGAQDVTGLDDLELFGWSLDNARLGARISPDYVGSDDYKLGLTGSVNLSRARGAPSFGAPDDGISLGLVGNKYWSAGPVGRWRSGRDDDGDLKGFEDIDWTVEAGGFLNLWPTEWLRLRGELRYGFGGHASWVADLGADFVAREGRWQASIGPRLAWADTDFTDTYFTVTPQDAAASPFDIPAFAARDDTWSPGVVASAEYRMAPRWSLLGVATWRRLTGDAADSPIVADLGSKDQFSAALSIRYWFGR